MKRQQILTSVLALGLLLALAVGLSLAQEPDLPEGSVERETGPAAPEATMNDTIPIQGQLNHADGTPVGGVYNLTLSLYDVETGGTALCSDMDAVAIYDGLFNFELDSCTASDIDGRQLWLGVQVGSDLEMTPRQGIYAVPYARSLRPGAVISGTYPDVGQGIVHVQQGETGSDGEGHYGAKLVYDDWGWWSAGVHGYARALGSGVSGHSHAGNYSAGVSGIAYATTTVNYGGCFYSYSDEGYGVYGYADNDSGTNYGVYGKTDSPGGYGVYGKGGAWGVYGVGMSHGVMGECGSSYGSSGYFHHTDGGLALVADSSAADNKDIVRFRNGGNTRFKVQGDGDVYCDGAFTGGGADFAEMLPGQDGLEPGDVLVIGLDGQLTRSTDPYQTSVVGVYSTRPGFVGGAGDEADLTGKVPLAIVGVVPLKASAENGAIHPGDLLVTASTPGHAMLAGDNPPQGTVLGKALGELEEGTGVIQVLVTLQ